MWFERMFEPVVTIATAVLGVAIIAVLVSRNANTAGVLQAATGGFATDIQAATAPVTGGGGYASNPYGINTGLFSGQGGVDLPSLY